VKIDFVLERQIGNKIIGLVDLNDRILFAPPSLANGNFLT
jgi:hypothetical protein